MKRLFRFTTGLIMAALAVGMAARPARAQALRIVGALSNFDCYNDTNYDCEGFEIEIEGIHKEQVAHTWNYSAFGAPTLTDGGTAAAPSAIIRYHSNSTVLHSGGVTHFGVSLTYYTQPGTILRRWLPASTISVPTPPPIPYILPGHQSVLTTANGVDSVHDSITNDTPDGATILWVLPYGNKVHGRGVQLEELMPTNPIVTNAVPMGSGHDHLTPSRLDPGVTWMSDDPPGSDDTESGILWYNVYKDVVTTGSGHGGKVTHSPGALIGRVMDATITNIGTPVPSAFDLSDTSVYGTQDVIGRVTIQGSVPAGGTIVNITSDNPAVIVPATVTIAANQISALFTIHTTAVRSLTTVNLTVDTGGGILSASFAVRPPDLYQLYLPLLQTGGGNSLTGTVYLTSPAPTGGTMVQLTSDSPMATVPAFVTVPAGSTTALFVIVTQTVTAATTANFTASYNGLVKLAALRIVPNLVTVSGTVTLDGLAYNAAAQTVTFTFRPNDGSAPFDRTAQISADKVFSFSDIPPASYTLHVKGEKYLAANLAVNAANNNVTGLTATLYGGDANNDNSADIADFGVLVNVYGSDAGIAGSGYDNRADFNNDGTIDIADFGILVNNYSSQGDP